MSIYQPSSRPSIWYLAYLTTAVIGFLANTGAGHQFFWNESAYLTDSVHFIGNALAFGFAVQFSRVFLKTEMLMPRADYLLKLLMIMSATGGISFILGYRDFSAQILMLTVLSLSIMPLFGLWVWKVLERTEARWYVAAWSVWSVAVVILLCRIIGLIEMNDYAIWAARMGLLLESVLLGMALVDQVNELRKDKFTAEEKLIEYLGESNAVLEQRVALRTQELEQAREAAEAMAETDALTGVGNRRHFINRGEEMIKQARRVGYPLSLLMFDIDHFKKINDGAP
ncbi:hypothetical protein BOW53_14700 [Solemya pervernicosa gill symbiont]|uniref:diguanylate cyclase n=1 Tax=Solemya pervernicosa gill symbiont TaxID=642797 RepID=A0A1T2L105_9GAMM|nr:hypothetical protein BOW53_14700 [Solemya pervernicosa gill symbiont]